MPNRTTLDVGPRSAPRIAHTAKTWGENATRWVCSTAEALRRSAPDQDVFDEFVDLVEETDDRAEIESALVRLAQRISGARRVEFLREETRPGSDDGEAAHGSQKDADPPTDAGSSDRDDVAPRPLDVTLRLSGRLGEEDRGTLRLFPSPRQRWSPRLVRRLRTLCALAAAAERGLAAAEGAARAPDTPLPDATILDAVLPYALGQAKRHHEPVSMLCISVDRLAAIDMLHGPELVETAVRRVAETIGNMLRASDVVARLDDDRVIALLPNACASDAVRIAESVREAIAAAGSASPTMPVLTASIGVSNYPAHAHDVRTLLAAADEAMTRAQRQGRNRVASAAPSGGGPMLTMTTCAG